MSAPRVLFATNMFPSSGRPVFGIIVQRLAEALRRQGVTVEVEFVDGSRGAAEYLRARDRIEDAVRLLRPDLVHVHFGWTFVSVPRVPVPRVVSFYGDDINGTADGRGGITLKSRVGIGIAQWAAASCERSIAVSEALRQRIWSTRARGRCEVVRDAVDPGLFSPGDRRAARRRLGVPHDRPLVLFPHSPVQATKRLDLARAALTALRARGDEASELWIVNGKHPSEMPEYYRAADALIVTSDLEGGPSCVKEALACGLPVVSVPAGDVHVLHEARGIAFLTERSPDALAAALESAIAAGAGPRTSRLPAPLTLDHAARRIIAVYESAIRRYAVAHGSRGGAGAATEPPAGDVQTG